MSSETSPGPTVAVVIATRDRPRQLGRCLEALATQVRAPDAVIVVDDGSDPPVTVVAGGMVAALGAVVVRREAAGGPGRARNAGWPLAGADYLAFTDDDCRPTPGWLAEMVRAAAPRRIVVGRVLPDPDDGAVRTMLDRSMTVTADDGRFSTCNVLYPRRLLEELGGFDDRFDRFGEDTDLGQRALLAGAEAVFATEALVLHAVHRRSPRELLRERRRIGEIARLIRHHPDLRRPPWAEGIWHTRDHRNLAGALLGLTALPLTPAGLPLLARWYEVAVERLAELPAGVGVKQLALIAAVDIGDLLSCVRGSVRHRTLLL